MRKCKKCGEEKPLTDFSKNTNCKGGRRPTCKLCAKAYVPRPRKNKRGELKLCGVCWQWKNEDKCFYGDSRGYRQSMCKECAKEDQRKRKYGVDSEQYMDMIKDQNGKCLICDLETRPLCVDHCHETGKIRGLLCLNCNSAIGKLKDDITLLERAIKYLS